MHHQLGFFFVKQQCAMSQYFFSAKWWCLKFFVWPCSIWISFQKKKTWMKKCVEEEDDDDEENDHQTYKEVKQATNKPLGTE